MREPTENTMSEKTAEKPGQSTARDLASQPDTSLSHIDGKGAAKMVDVGHKPTTCRTATATAVCSMNVPTAEAIRSNINKKGDVFAVARVAGIQAAKKTSELIPLCHAIPLSSVQVEFEWLSENELGIEGSASCLGQTGVEMEALCATSVAALTIYDMCKAMDRDIEIRAIRLQSKTGGKSDYQRPSDG